MTVLAVSTLVPIRQTIHEIDDVLSRYGAIEFSRIGSAAKPTGVRFTLVGELGPAAFHIEVNTNGVQRRLEEEYAAGKIHRGRSSPDQAERTAWRQLYRWLEANLAAIDSGLLTATQLLSPFLEVAPGRTVYDVLVERSGSLALPAPREATRGR